MLSTLVQLVGNLTCNQNDGSRILICYSVLSGGIDPHTHMEMPFMGQESIDDFFSGQAAALAGGTTMHIDFALPIDGDLAAGYQAWEKKAEKSCMDYGFHMAVTKWSDDVARDMEWLVKEKGRVTWTRLFALFIFELEVKIFVFSCSFDFSDRVMCTGINSFKFFMAYKGALMVTDEELIQGFKKCKELGALPQVHAENGDAVVEGQTRMIELGIIGPEGHPLSRPPVVHSENFLHSSNITYWTSFY